MLNFVRQISMCVFYGLRDYENMTEGFFHYLICVEWKTAPKEVWYVVEKKLMCLLNDRYFLRHYNTNIERKNTAHNARGRKTTVFHFKSSRFVWPFCLDPNFRHSYISSELLLFMVRFFRRQFSYACVMNDCITSGNFSTESQIQFRQDLIVCGKICFQFRPFQHVVQLNGRKSS